MSDLSQDQPSFLCVHGFDRRTVSCARCNDPAFDAASRNVPGPHVVLRTQAECATDALPKALDDNERMRQALQLANRHMSRHNYAQAHRAILHGLGVKPGRSHS